MFFFKKKNSQNPPETTDGMAKKGIKSMDTVITGVILWGIVASLYGVKKLRDKKSDHPESTDTHHK